MDSLTQIILGAAVGEIALGKKIGNRAMVWGAIGGTIPDLDVLANSFMDPIDALAFHRGFSHSILFSVTAPLLLGWIVHQSYQRKWHTTWPYKIVIALINMVILISLTYGFNLLFRNDDGFNWWVVIPSIAVAGYLTWRLYKYYLRKELEVFDTTFKEWYWLFLLALATHWMLDCFTAFGTQIFVPFSNYRVAFNNIAVADPFYTIPFMICVIVAAALKRNTYSRKYANLLGIGLSSAYMLWTIANKVHVDQVFQGALNNRGIEVSKCQCSPTILNNILWSCSADAGDAYYTGRYSLFDSNPNFHYLSRIPKQDSIHHMLGKEEEYQILEWFAKEYLVAFPTDSIIYLSDVRYGGLTDTIKGPKDLIFNFTVSNENGDWIFDENRERPQGDFVQLLKDFIRRIKGY